jgi:hypothetical protein
MFKAQNGEEDMSYVEGEVDPLIAIDEKKRLL